MNLLRCGDAWRDRNGLIQKFPRAGFFTWFMPVRPQGILFLDKVDFS
jgi:hypothetical protein